RGWSVRLLDNPPPAIASGTVRPRRPAGLLPGDDYPLELYDIPLPSDRHRGPQVKVRRVHQSIIIRAPLSQAVPAAPRAMELFFKWEQVNVDDSGVIMAGPFLQQNFIYEVISEVADTQSQAEALRKCPPVDARQFYEPAYLYLPTNFDRVRSLAER